jgi:hypothetical protein
MNKSTDIEIINRSIENTATVPMRDRYEQAKKNRKGIENLLKDKEKPNRTNSTFAISTSQRQTQNCKRAILPNTPVKQNHLKINWVKIVLKNEIKKIIFIFSKYFELSIAK